MNTSFHDLPNNILIVLITTALVLLSLGKTARKAKTWKATVTPLASIIGSGFLIMTPLYLMILGKYALVAIVGIVILSYMMGHVMRFNILHLEKILQWKARSLFRLEQLSNLSLAIAYLISVAFYIKLLALFLLRSIFIHDEILSNIIATSILLTIGIAGKFRGFKRLEALEEYAVNIKLSIIVALIITLALYNMNLFFAGQWHLDIETPKINFDSIRKLLGTIIIVQGFETSRFLSLNYSAKIRVSTMKYAQIIAGIIYISFMALSLVAFGDVKTINETSIIDASEKILFVLPYLLAIAAIMSQFSASLADTIGAGGLFYETSKRKVKPENSYLIVTIIAILLIWVTNIFEVTALASRAFALYYAIQSLEAILVNFKQKKNDQSWLQTVLFSFMFLIMISVTIFGIHI